MSFDNLLETLDKEFKVNSNQTSKNLNDAKDVQLNTEIPNVDICNDPQIEQAFLMKVTMHMEIYYKLLCTCSPRQLKLTDVDDEIYAAFKESFPEFNLKLFEEKDLKSENAKEEWRNFMLRFQHKVEDPLFGCLLRFDSSKEYTNENTIFGVRLQHFAIEIARNREGFNDTVYENYQEAMKNKNVKL